jgi:hypothetical protein
MRCQVARSFSGSFLRGRSARATRSDDGAGKDLSTMVDTFAASIWELFTA